MVFASVPGGVPVFLVVSHSVPSDVGWKNIWSVRLMLSQDRLKAGDG